MMNQKLLNKLAKLPFKKKIFFQQSKNKICEKELLEFRGKNEWRAQKLNGWNCSNIRISVN